MPGMRGYGVWYRTGIVVVTLTGLAAGVLTCMADGVRTADPGERHRVRLWLIHPFAVIWWTETSSWRAMELYLDDGNPQRQSAWPNSPASSFELLGIYSMERYEDGIHWYCERTLRFKPLHWTPLLLAGPIYVIGRRLQRHRRRKRGLCLDCGYNLAGNTTGRCPECGNTVRPAISGQDAISAHRPRR